MFFLWNKSKWCEFQDVSSDSKTALSQPDQVRSIDATKYFVFREAQHDLSEKNIPLTYLEYETSVSYFSELGMR